jgi:uncharacterized membrane protein YhaH (DUF805 family)
MNPGEAIRSCFQRYIDPTGRARRSELWWWMAFTTAVYVLLSLLPESAAIITKAIFALGTLLPSFAVQIRRLHDIDRTGWWLLIAFIPVIGWIVLLVWACMRGTAGDNRFGPDPLGSEAAVPASVS